MSRWLFRLSFPALGVVVGLILFGIHDPAPTEPESSSAEDPEPVTNLEGIVPTQIEDEGPDIVFKWQSRDGSWHYADSPPDHTAWNVIAIDPKGIAPPETQPEEDELRTPYEAPFSLRGDPSSG
ncbi:DUF4124 domain-containing protein [Tamilnaduibacter salinus]|nr:DUF4124 domain-containing protein [Tamilnaduibacter salinus]